MKKASFLSLLAILIMAFTSCSKSSNSNNVVSPQQSTKTYHGQGFTASDDIVLQGSQLYYGYKFYSYSLTTNALTVYSREGGTVGQLTVSGSTLINNSPSIFNSKYYVLY